MSRDDGPRGGQWLSRGEDTLAAKCDLSGPRPGGGATTERDWCDTSGALELSRKIERFWQEHTGRAVRCRIEPVGLYGIQAVRSDLVGGLPR